MFANRPPHRHVHRCCCSFVPPDALEHLAKEGHIDSLNLQATFLYHKKREERVKKMEEFASLAPVANESGDRIVYDSEGKWQQRVTLKREEGGPANSDDAVNAAYDNAGKTRDFFKDVLNRKSIDNANMNLILNVHYGKNYNNAFWDGDEMTFGDGDGKIFTGFENSLDVVAHELTHGVTQWEANLVYQGQSGALNEHFSDVFGTVITQYAEGQTADTADWLIGDEIMGPDLEGEALRSMIEPGTAYDNALMGKDNQRSHMKDYYTGTADNGGVHWNSGIPNKAFYIAAKEMEIGTIDAGKIWYDALQKLGPNTQFNEAVKTIVESARQLVKSGTVQAGAPQKIRAAFKQVGLPT